MILDTNALSAWAEGNPSCRKALAGAGLLCLPVPVLGEYWFGIRQSKWRADYEEWLAAYLPTTTILTIDQATADRYAELRLNLKRQGTPIPANDAWIASLVLQHQLPLLSNDAHFDVVAGLRRIPF